MDELKPDTSDRRPARSRRSAPVSTLPVSRQYIMAGIGILILLLLVLGIWSSLNGAGKERMSVPANNAVVNHDGDRHEEKQIDMTGSATLSNPPSSVNGGEMAQDLSGPPVAPMPTEAAPAQTPSQQHRIELTGDLNSALTNQQTPVNDTFLNVNNTGLPTMPATVNAASSTPVSKPVSRPLSTLKTEKKPPVVQKHRSVPKRETESVAVSTGRTAKKSVVPAVTARHAVREGKYTLQLSSASRSDTLTSWAKKQGLTNWRIYKTTRNSQPWFVLVSGSYATSADAKRAIATLSADVRAHKPWVKPLSQVKKEAGE